MQPAYPPPFRFPQKETTDLKYYYFTIDSRDRDRTAWPSTAEYQVKMEPENTFTGATLGRNYKNVKSLELMNATYPNLNNVLNEAYLFLCIPELEGLMYDGTNITAMKSFAKLTPTRNTTAFVYSDLGLYDDPPILEFHTQGKRLDRLTVQFKRPDGTLFSFGTDNGETPNSTLQTSLTFRVGIVEAGVP